jgi:hypothetical protein
MYLYIMRLFQYYVDALREVDQHRDPKPPTNKHSSLSLPPVLRPPSLTLLTAGREASCFPPIALALSLNFLSPPITLWSQESPPLIISVSTLDIGRLSSHQRLDCRQECRVASPPPLGNMLAIQQHPRLVTDRIYSAALIEDFYFV